MPVRSKGPLLAGIGALLGVCAAGGGCQSLRIDSPRADSGATILHPVADSRPTSSPSSGPIFNGPIVMMLRPTTQEPAPVDRTVERDAVSPSAWRPIVRASSEPLVPGEPGPIQTVQAQSIPAPGPQARFTADSVPASQPRLFPTTASAHVEADSHVSTVSLFHPPRPIATLPVPREFDKQPMPPYVIEPPDILLIRASKAISLPTQPLDGQHLVKMDGFVNMGIYGEVFLAGHTLEQARDVVAAALLARRVKGRDPKDIANPAAKDTDLTIEDIKRELQVDVLAFNSKFYFIVIDGGGYGQRVFRLPFTGNETVLDAMSQIGGLPEVSSRKNMWVARATPAEADHPCILPIDWRGITQVGSGRTNYQMRPYDRLYVKADLLLAFNNGVTKVVNPIEKLLGVTLLGASTVQTIKGNGGAGGGL